MITVAMGAGLALIAPSAANAAAVVSQANGQMVDTGILTPVVSNTGAAAIDSTGTAVTTDQPIDASVASGLVSLTSGSNVLFGTGGILQLGAVAQYADANNDGSSDAFAGAVSDKPSFVTTSLTPGSTVGTPASGADAQLTVNTNQILGGTGTPAVSLDLTIGTLSASASQPTTGNPTSSYDFADLGATVGGSVTQGVLGPLSGTLGGTIGLINSLAGTTLTNPIAADGTVTVSSAALTAALQSIDGVSNFNQLPPNTDITPVIVQAVINTVTTQLNGLSTAANGLGNPLVTALVATLTTAITGAVGTLSASLLTPLTTALSNIVALVVNGQSPSPGVAGSAFTETAFAPTLKFATPLRLGLANATVGPNAGPSAAPIVNSDSLAIAGGVAAIGAGIALLVGLIRRRRTVLAS